MNMLPQPQLRFLLVDEHPSRFLAFHLAKLTGGHAGNAFEDCAETGVVCAMYSLNAREPVNKPKER
jgi:hypothetical protein